MDIVEKISCTFSSSGALQNSPDRWRHPGGKPCKYCPYRPICKMLEASILQLHLAFKVPCRREQWSTSAPGLAGRREYDQPQSRRGVEALSLTASQLCHLHTAGEELPDGQPRHCHRSERQLGHWAARRCSQNDYGGYGRCAKIAVSCK